MGALENLLEQAANVENIERLGRILAARTLRAAQAEKAKKSVDYLETNGLFDGMEPIKVPKKIAADKDFETVAKPEQLKAKLKGVSLGKDKDGYFVFTHRCRSKSYSSPEAIPDSKIKFVESTG